MNTYDNAFRLQLIASAIAGQATIVGSRAPGQVAQHAVDIADAVLEILNDEERRAGEVLGTRSVVRSGMYRAD